LFGDARRFVQGYEIRNLSHIIGEMRGWFEDVGWTTLHFEISTKDIALALVI
jgi:hypothetical protein